LYQGAELGEVYIRNRVVEVVVILDPKARRSPEEVGDVWLPVGNPDAPGAEKGRVQLREGAGIFLSDGRRLVTHEGGRRVQQVKCKFDTKKAEDHWRKNGGPKIASLTDFVAEAEKRVAALNLPPSSTEFTGEVEALRTARY